MPIKINADLEIDTEAKLIRETTGLFPFNKIKSASLESCDLVQLTKVVRRHREYTTIYFSVFLPHPWKTYLLFSSENYQESRKKAEEFANLLHFDLEDDSSGETIRREAGSLNLSIKERWKKMKISATSSEADDRSLFEAMEASPENRIITSKSPIQASYTLPEQSVSILHYIHLLFWLSLPACFLWLLGKMNYDNAGFGTWAATLGILCLLSIPAASVFILGLVRNGSNDVIEITANALTKQTFNRFGSITHSLPLNEIEEFQVISDGANPHILTRSDKEDISFGEGLNYTELQWLYHSIRQFIIEC